MWNLDDIQMSTSIKKDSLEDSHVHLFTYCPWHFGVAELSSWDFEYGLQNLTYLKSDPFQKKCTAPEWDQSFQYHLW